MDKYIFFGIFLQVGSKYSRPFIQIINIQIIIELFSLL